MTITALPTPPSRNDPANFAERGDAFLGALPTFVTEANALQADVNSKQSAAATSASSAATSATNAATSATAAGTSATNAANSATAASTSATNAANSATAAANSASAAATSATAAANSATQAATTLSSKADLSGAAFTGPISATAMNSTPIGQTTAAAGSFTTITASGNIGVAGTADPFSRSHGRMIGMTAASGNAAIEVNGASGASGNLEMGAGGVRYGSVNASSSGVSVTSNAAIPINFNINNAYVGCFDSSGNLLVGETSGTNHIVRKDVNATTLSVFNIAATSPEGLNIYLGGLNNSSAGKFIRCNDLGGTKLQVLSNGNVQNNNNSYGALSDVKLKENVVDATPKLDKLMQVRVVNYNLKTDPDHKQLGVIAQEVEQIFPGIVEETPDYEIVNKTREIEVPAVLGDDGEVIEEATTETEEYTELVPTGETTKSVKYSVFVPMLIKAMQEQQAVIDDLKKRLAAVEAKVA